MWRTPRLNVLDFENDFQAYIFNPLANLNESEYSFVLEVAV